MVGLLQKYLSLRAPTGGWSTEQIELFVEATESLSPELTVQAFRRVGTRWTAGWTPQPGDILNAAGDIRAEIIARKPSQPYLPYYTEGESRNDWEKLTDEQRAEHEAMMAEARQQLDQPKVAAAPVRNVSLQALGASPAWIEWERERAFAKVTGQSFDEPEPPFREA